jgi:phosphatidylglycerol---prolipoprotein diacylglyceryl transferase
VYPRLLPGVSSYFLMWLVAVAACSTVGAWLIVRRRDPFLSRFILGLVLFGFVLAGSKLLYLLEAATFPHADYVPDAFRGLQHGFRIPGGILLLALLGPIAARVVGVAWKSYADSFVMVLALMLVCVRTGCFLNGCCFGRLSILPWAVTFPPASWAYFYQVKYSMILPTARWSLPVHPLQLYFLCSALLSAVVVTVWPSRSLKEGDRYLAFLGLFFGTTLMFEPLRANRLTPNEWVALLGTLSVAIAIWSRGRGKVEAYRIPDAGVERRLSARREKHAVG